ncbi:GNAT family N-acetyltransferase [Tumidithrix elongata RA019]|uniref:GNAT family N-acetyltransferase n=1 Tax=Tumidithrix elongata BACA0141 TaxID=2716417 RepID=A0AAW9Q9D7_9CYAN|nr:GNAT family N-acetyltransferase [Tumidithrix elongata RA019]
MSNSPFLIRAVTRADVPNLFDLIKALAEYEKLSHAVTGDVKALEHDLFCEKPCIEAIVAECDRKPVGFALFFTNYSTFLTKSGIYLEDLFVLPDYRGRSIGKALIVQVAKIALERGCGRLEWAVLDWNLPAIAFYERMGADILTDWRICRVTGESLQEFAQKS